MKIRKGDYGYIRREKKKRLLVTLGLFAVSYTHLDVYKRQVLVCLDDFPLGWGKINNGTLKNKYYAGWRMV